MSCYVYNVVSWINCNINFIFLIVLRRGSTGLKKPRVAQRGKAYREERESKRAFGAYWESITLKYDTSPKNVYFILPNIPLSIDLGYLPIKCKFIFFHNKSSCSWNAASDPVKWPEKWNEQLLSKNLKGSFNDINEILNKLWVLNSTYSDNNSKWNYQFITNALNMIKHCLY